MAVVPTHTRIRDLARLLSGLRGEYDELFAILAKKNEALRLADISRMQELTEREMHLTQRLQERQGLRRQIMDALGRDLGIAGSAARRLTLTQIALHATREIGEELTRVGTALREAVSRVAQANRVFASATREIVDHLRWTMNSVKPALAQPLEYGPRGRAAVQPAAIMIDALG